MLKHIWAAKKCCLIQEEWQNWDLWYELSGRVLNGLTLIVCFIISQSRFDSTRIPPFNVNRRLLPLIGNLRLTLVGFNMYVERSWNDFLTSDQFKLDSWEPQDRLSLMEFWFGHAPCNRDKTLEIGYHYSGRRQSLILSGLLHPELQNPPFASF